MNDLILINDTSDRPTVSGRELHEFLEVGTAYKDWFPRMSEYGFTEGVDYTPLISEHPQNKQPFTDHQLTIDMAKEIAMIQRSEKGKQARQYFLEVERAWNDPMATLARALKFSQKILDSIKTENGSLRQVIESQAPKVLFADSVSASDDCINVGAMAKILKQNGHKIGEVRFYEWLRELGYCMKEKGRSYNHPTQRAVERGFLCVRESTRISPSGKTHIDSVTLVTGKGQRHFVTVFDRELRMSGGS